MKEKQAAKKGRKKRLPPRRLRPIPAVDRVQIARSGVDTETIYPGRLLVVKHGSKSLLPADDANINAEDSKVAAVAIGWAQSEPSPGLVAVEKPDGGRAFAPVLWADPHQPSTGVPQLDAWCVLADAVKQLWLGRSRGSAALGLSRTGRMEAFDCLVLVLRDESNRLLKVVPGRFMLHALAAVVTMDPPSPPILLAAMKEVVAVAPHWSRAKAVPALPPKDEVAHGDDFTWVRWFGAQYQFTKGNQSRTIELLWQAWEKSGRTAGAGLSQSSIGSKIESNDNDFRLSKVFKGHPAFKTMICPVSKGVYCLKPPGEKTAE